MRRVPARRLIALAAILTLGIGAAAETPAVAGSSGDTQPVGRSVLYNHASTYPKLIRLKHAGLFGNGRILASYGTWNGTSGVGQIAASDDDGRSFQPLGQIPDPGAAHGLGMCCSTLYELPSRVGSMPAGTLLFADSVGYNAPIEQRHTRQRLWRSFDGGYTWSYLSDITVAKNQYPTWEPDLSVDTKGNLVVFFSDETDKPKHDQKLAQMLSPDGVHWGSYKETVVDDRFSVRPGMADVERLPDGTYFMAYEMCNYDPKHLCSAFYRTSKDGWNYGDPHNPGTVIRTADGKYARHTPTLALAPGPGRDGTILMISEILVNNDGSYAPGNGKTVLANDHAGAGPWYEMPAPVAVPGASNTGCENFHPSILASTDGDTVIEATTDKDGNTCKTYYGTAPLVRP